MALDAIIFDDYVIEVVHCSHLMKQINNSLSHEIIGYLREGKLDSQGLILWMIF